MMGPGSLVDFWRGVFGAPEAGWDFPLLVFSALVLFGFVIAPAAWLLSWVEAKFVADLQARVGPARVGAAGFWQPLADALKLMGKDREDEASWPQILRWVTLIFGLAPIWLIPWARALTPADSEIAVAVPVFVALLAGSARMLVGFEVEGAGARGAASERGFALDTTFLLIVMAAVAAVSVHAGGLSWSAVAESQGFWPHEWRALQSPGAFVAMIALGTVLAARPRRALFPEGSGWTRAAASAIEALEPMYFWGFFTLLFFGGYRIPSAVSEALYEVGADLVVVFLEVLTLLLKIVVLRLGSTWARTVSSQLSTDQSLAYSWRYLVPLVTLSVLLSIVWRGLIP